MSQDISPDTSRDDGDYLSFKPGQRLKKARELRGLSVDQVATELRLSRRIVDGIEADDYRELPEPAFVRGYMRRYAQLVKLSPDDIATRFDQSYAADAATPAPDARPRNPIQILGDLARPKLRLGRLLSWASLALILLLFVGLFWGRQDSASVVVEEEPAVVEVEPVAPVVSAVTVPSAPMAAPSDVLPLPSGPAQLPAPVGSNLAPLAAGPAAAPAVTDQVKLVLTADSWISIKDAKGQVLTSAVHKAGASLSLNGEAPFAVNIGNAPGVSLSINGKAVDLKPHTKGVVASLSVQR